MAQPIDNNDSYSLGTGFIFLFNLIVGTGALTMPAAFAHAGWLMSLIVIILLCIMSFITVTFVVETMSIGNAVLKSRREQIMTSSYGGLDQETREDLREDSDNSEPHDEMQPLMTNSACTGDLSSIDRYNFDITERVELGELANIFFPKVLVRIFYMCIAVYLYGDLSIYLAAIAKSLRDVTCTWEHDCNGNTTLPYNNSDPCWAINENTIIPRDDAYRLYVGIAIILLGPFAFFNVQKTKYLQILTSFFRWSSFISMIGLASIAVLDGKGRGKPVSANVGGLPNLFGVCVYSFMCHHSLPSLVTPIDKKRKIFWLIFADFLLILVFYLLLSFTGSLAFGNLADIYTLNFQRDKCTSGTGDDIVPQVTFLQYFLPLFPVLTLSASFPIISITLTNNLKSLFIPVLDTSFNSNSQDPTTIEISLPKNVFINRILFPLASIIPPVMLALITEDLQTLVGFTGSYAGTAIQYIIPALLVFYARNRSPFDENSLAGEGLRIRNSFRSPFRNRFWVMFVLIWAFLSIIFVTLDHIFSKSI